jgi:hypothetical protein
MIVFTASLTIENNVLTTRKNTLKPKLVFPAVKPSAVFYLGVKSAHALMLWPCAIAIVAAGISSRAEAAQS